MALPRPREGQVHVKVTPIVAGTLTLPEYVFVSPVDRSIKHAVPSMCFLVEHPTALQRAADEVSAAGGNHTAAPTRFMFDLGLRGAAEDYIPEIQAHLPNRHPVTHRPSAPETLEKNGIAPDTLEAVILSHVHWDHHGDPHRFPRATFVVGNGSLGVVAHGMPGRGTHSHFDPNLFRGAKALELSAPDPGSGAVPPNSAPLPKTMLASDARWEPLGPFPAVLDLFGDGAAYVIPAPGHLPGHINLLCRTGPTHWTYLGGDAFHDFRLLTGEKQIAYWEDQGCVHCVHIDKEEAEATIARIRRLQNLCKQEGQDLEVIVAHDNGWYETNKHRCMT